MLLLGIFGGDSTHLHSWGSLFIQDVVVPLRRKPFTPEQHIRLLRWSIVGVAVFVFSSASSFPGRLHFDVVDGDDEHLYRRSRCGHYRRPLLEEGTTAGAWAGLLTGSTLSLMGMAAQSIYGKGFPLNGVQIAFLTMLITLAVYIAVSLLTCREDFNMDRMLHRGAYAKIKSVIGDQVEAPARRGSTGAKSSASTKTSPSEISGSREGFLSG